MAASRSPGTRERAASERREAIIHLKIELETSKVDWLIAFGYLRQIERKDPKQVRAALYWFLDRALKSGVASGHSKVKN